MEKIEKDLFTTAPLQGMNSLLGESSEGAVDRVIDLTLDNSPPYSEIPKSVVPTKEVLKERDTRSEWASTRSFLRPVTGEWVQAKADFLNSLKLNNINDESYAGVTPVSQDVEDRYKYDAHLDEVGEEIAGLINQTSDFLKEELEVIRAEMQNLSLVKGAIQSINQKIGAGSPTEIDLDTVKREVGWVVGERMQSLEDRIINFQENLPGVSRNANQNVLDAIKLFEDKCIRLGVKQLESLSQLENIAESEQVENLERNLLYLVDGQKRIIESISEVISGVKHVCGSLDDIPTQQLMGKIANSQFRELESIKEQIEAVRDEDRQEERKLKRAVYGLIFLCLFTSIMIIFNIYR